MDKKKIKINYWSIGAVIIGIVGIASIGLAFAGGYGYLNIQNATINMQAPNGTDGADISNQSFGGSTSDNWDVGGNLTVAGTATITGGFAGSKNSLSTISTRVASTTLATTDSGKTYILTTTTEFVLPATTTASGVHYKFVLGGLTTASSSIRTYDLTTGIEGTLIVAGAVVDCDKEARITFGTDFENLGDYVEVWSNGTYWFIGDSGALTGSALACSAS